MRHLKPINIGIYHDLKKCIQIYRTGDRNVALFELQKILPSITTKKHKQVRNQRTTFTFINYIKPLKSLRASDKYNI